MTKLEYLRRFRIAIGNPKQSQVSNAQLEPYAADALSFMAETLDYPGQRLTRMVLLEEDVQNYPLPRDVSRIVWVNIPATDTRLDPASTFAWQRDGWDWVNAASGTPTEYAFEDRELILNCAPDATFLEDLDPAYLEVKVITTGAGLTLSGVPQLPEADLRFAVLEAAVRYLTANPSNENTARLNGQQALLDRELKTSLGRTNHPIEEHQPAFAVHVTRRRGAR